MIRQGKIPPTAVRRFLNPIIALDGSLAGFLGHI
jgi:hypothetical protein